MKQFSLKTTVQHKWQYKFLVTAVFFILFGILAKLYFFPEPSSVEPPRLLAFLLLVFLFLSSALRPKTCLGDLILLLYMLFFMAYLFGMN